MAKKEEKFVRGDRAFLNKPGYHGDASIGYRMRVSNNGYFEGYINFRDCSQDISIELDVHNDDWYENTCEKVDAMLRILRQVKKDLPAARKALKEAKKKQDENG